MVKTKKKITKKKNDDKEIINKKISKNEKKVNQECFSSFEVVVIIVISIIFGSVLGSIITINSGLKKSYSDSVDEIVNTYNNIKEKYYKDIDDKELLNAAVRGMVSSLDDPHTVYMSEDEAYEFNQSIEGSYDGIGATIGEVDEDIVVVDIFKNSPSDKAGLKINDVIRKVNNKVVKGKSLDEIVELIKANKTVTFEVERGGKTKSIKIKTGKVEIPSVSSQVIQESGKKIGLISIDTFALNTYKQFKSELKNIEKKNIDSLIIDVRDNSGGYLDQVDKILSLFVSKKKVIYQIETKGKIKKYFSTGNGKRNYKVAVLINGESASASEILAVAMKESYGAYLVGVKTYGKGTVQEEYNLSSGASFKYTTEKWLTPKGKSIDGKGITPDKIVELNDTYYETGKIEDDNQLQEAIKMLIKK